LKECCNGVYAYQHAYGQISSGEAALALFEYNFHLYLIFDPNLVDLFGLQTVDSFD
jgi:hypothetical protein